MQLLNLQGKWNDKVILFWVLSYMVNINMQMNYWLVEVMNFFELYELFFQMFCEFVVNGVFMVCNMYYCCGWVVYYNILFWCDSYFVDGMVCVVFWNFIVGWFSSYLWECWLFMGDKKFFVDDVYLLMKGVVEFYVDWLVEDVDGVLVMLVSMLLENNFIVFDG